jgi:hypothetical protein
MKKLTRLLIFMLFFSGLSCSSYTKKDFADKNIVKIPFARFLYHNKGKDDQYAFNVMQSVKVKEMFALVKEKYGIEIDTTEYDKFLEKGDAKPIISLGWGPLNTYFSWQLKEFFKTKTRAEIAFTIVEDMEYDTVEVDFEFSIFVNNQRKVFVYLGDIETPADILPQFTAELARKK